MGSHAPSACWWFGSEGAREGFASGIDPDMNIVFENFAFEPRESADHQDPGVAPDAS